MRPSSADTSEPACVKRKILSMNSSTSWPPSSRKYSATVRPVKSHAQTRSGRLGHLPVDQRDFRLCPIVRIEHARLLHFHPQIVAFTRALADARKHGHAAMFQSDVVDQLHDDDGFADAGAAEQSDLSAAQIGLEQVDNLDPALEHLQLRGLFIKSRRLPVDRPFLRGVHRTHVVHGLADDVHHAAQRLISHRDLDRRGPGSPPSCRAPCRR